MMFLPLILIFILPKMMNDPETRKVRLIQQQPFEKIMLIFVKKEMENIQLPKYEMPEMSEVLTNFFGGADPKKSIKGSSKGPAKRKIQN